MQGGLGKTQFKLRNIYITLLKILNQTADFKQNLQDLGKHYGTANAVLYVDLFFKNCFYN